MKAALDRAVLVSPLFAALALHVWASRAYPQDAFVFLLLVMTVPLGGRIRYTATLRRSLAFAFFLGGAALGWMHTPDLGYGPGTVPRFASLVALGTLLAATSRFYLRATLGRRGEPEKDAPRDTATFALATLSVAASGTTRLGPPYGVFAALVLVFGVVALRRSDRARARRRDLERRDYAALAGSLGLASLVAVLLAGAVVPLQERVRKHFESSYLVHDMAGFGAGASLTDLHDMIESDVEVLRITPPPHAAPVDYLRGAVYDAYRHDGLWLETPQALRLHEVRVDPATPAPGTAVTLRRVAGRPGRFFVPLEARDVRVASGSVEADALGALLTVASDRTAEYSFVPGPRDRMVPVPPTDADTSIPQSEREAVTKLAEQWTQGAETTSAKLDALRLHLARGGYRYSLEMDPHRGDPLLLFLVTDRVGYCTHFATAMVMLARSVGIPARLVTGYRVGEWSPVAHQYIVREKNAHAWVEVWVDGAWVTQDPTPLLELPQNSRHVAELGALLEDAGNRFEQAVTYALSHVTLVQLLFLLTGLGATLAIVRRLGRRRARSGKLSSISPLDLPLPAFARLASLLERSGMVRERSEPLGRFAERLRRAGFRDAALLVERYAALRYGGMGDRGPLEEEMNAFDARAPH